MATRKFSTDVKRRDITTTNHVISDDIWNFPSNRPDKFFRLFLISGLCSVSRMIFFMKYSTFCWIFSVEPKCSDLLDGGAVMALQEAS